jgi:hypothetical protein
MGTERENKIRVIAARLPEGTNRRMLERFKDGAEKVARLIELKTAVTSIHEVANRDFEALRARAWNVGNEELCMTCLALTRTLGQVVAHDLPEKRRLMLYSDDKKNAVVIHTDDYRKEAVGIVCRITALKGKDNLKDKDLYEQVSARNPSRPGADRAGDVNPTVAVELLARIVGSESFRKKVMEKRDAVLSNIVEENVALIMAMVEINEEIRAEVGKATEEKAPGKAD